MAIIGGNFTAQNKILPGVYINAVTEDAGGVPASQRGTVAVALPFTWGEEGKITELDQGEFYKNAMKLFGFSAMSPQLLALREIFSKAQKALVYRISGTGGAKATCDLATAKHNGSVGNNLKIAVAANIDNNDMYDVSTYLDNALVDLQTVSSSADLVDNDYVTFSASASLTASAGTALSGGDDGAAPTVSDYQSYLDKLEKQSFNVLVCPVTTEEAVSLFASYTKRMRKEHGVDFQLVAYRNAADDLSVISVENAVSGYPENAIGFGEWGLVYWVAGASAGCALNKSLTNTAYDGELTVNTEYTLTQLESAIKSGKFIFNDVHGVPRVLEDINSLVTYTKDKGKLFRLNQTVRAGDNLSDAIRYLYSTQYSGAVANDEDGRTSLWNDICKLIQAAVAEGIFTDFSTEAVTVTAGNDVDTTVVQIAPLAVAHTMAKLYLTLVLS